jgi:hypothetical protein
MATGKRLPDGNYPNQTTKRQQDAANPAAWTNP